MYALLASVLRTQLITSRVKNKLLPYGQIIPKYERERLSKSHSVGTYIHTFIYIHNVRMYINK